MQYSLSIKLKHGEKTFFGPGPARLLALIGEGNSLNQASSKLGMAYSKAWKIIKEAETMLGFFLLERRRGGMGGGGSTLTANAIGLLEQYNQFQTEMYRVGNQLFEEYFGDIP